MNEKIKALEMQKHELIEQIKEEAEKTKNERELLARRIFELEINQKNHVDRTPEINIYNEDNIVKVSDENDPDRNKKVITALYKAYAKNPYCDKNRNEKMLLFLDELQTVCVTLDEYYNQAVIETSAQVIDAQKKNRSALQQKNNHRMEVLAVQGIVRDSVLHSVIGNNELRCHGADDITANPLYGLAHSSMDGTEIVDIVKSAIIHEVESTINKESEKYINQSKNVFDNSNELGAPPFAYI